VYTDNYVFTFSFATFVPFLPTGIGKCLAVTPSAFVQISSAGSHEHPTYAPFATDHTIVPYTK